MISRIAAALLDASGRTVTRRQYVGDAVIDDGKVTMQRFDGQGATTNNLMKYI